MAMPRYGQESWVGLGPGKKPRLGRGRREPVSELAPGTAGRREGR